MVAAVRSGERNAELFLLLGSAAFVMLAWRALEAASFELPANDSRILAQFLVTLIAGHLAIRVVAPGASGLPYAIAMMLAAVGLAFVTRLDPSVAADQANWITLGVIVMAGSLLIGRRYRRLRGYRYTAALVAVTLLVATGLFGDTINGARLWITVGGQTIQTTELIKLFLVVFLAGYLVDAAPVLSAPRLTFGGRSYSALPYLLPLAITLVVSFLALALLKDLGTIALLLLLTVSALYVATGQVRFVAGGLVLMGFTAVAGYYAFDHAQTRIDVWLHPFDDADGAGYQTTQSLFALEAGGVTGEGLGLGDPDVIPAAPTDYIYSAVGEELGFAGAIGVAALYVLLLFSGLRVALAAPDAYGRLLASCIALLIAIQAFVIMAGNLRMIPTTGITLPFVSYGGSSLIVNFALIGVLLGISDASARD